jgi:serine/threonine-protein kinase
VIVASGGGLAVKGLPPDIDNQPTVISKEPPALLPLAMANLPPAEMGRLLQGERLGHYELQEFVGGGGMGAVFRALDPMLNRIVAVKVLSKVQSDDEETVRRFKNEAQSAARLDHENISRVHFVGEERGWHYIVFEFIEGVNLRDLVQTKGPLPLGEALSYTLQVTDALAHASQRDVVHRDIKPSNVLITPEGRAKLVDMGLARLHQVEHPDHDLTASGVTLGTFDYISPEQARDPRHADVRSDLYSLGCTLYFMLTGRPPFPDGTVLQKLLQHQADEPTDPQTLRADLTDDVTRVLRKMLAKSPQQRYQQPDELAADLMTVAANHGVTLPSPTAVHWNEPGEREPPLVMRHLPWLVPVSVLGLVALALALAGSATVGNVEPAPIHHLAPATGPLPAARSSSASLQQPAGSEARAPIHPRDRTLAISSPNVSAAGLQHGSASGESGSSRSTRESSKLGPTADGRKLPAASSATDRGATDDAATDHTGSGSPEPIDPAATPTSLPHATVAGTNPSAPLANPARPDVRVPSLDREASIVSRSVLDILAGVRLQLRSLITGAPSDATIPKVSHGPRGLPLATKVAGPDSAALSRSVSEAPAATALPTVGTSPAVPASIATAGASATSPAGERKALLIVSREADRQNDGRDASSTSTDFASLGDACRSARSGDVIELRFDGRLDERPIAISNLRLTIRGADGFSPIVGFLPRDGEPWSQASAMLSLGGSQLTLVNVQLEFDVPQRVPAERWTFIELRAGEAFRLESSTLTVRNATDLGTPFHPDVAVFDIRPVPGGGSMMPPDAPMVRPPTSVQLKNSIVRGEAVVVRSNQAQPLQLTWENGLLATTERFLIAGGAPSDPKPQGQIQIELRHVTALVRAGFCRLTNTPDSPQQLPLEVIASDCIFICDPASALVEQTGSDDPEDFRRRVSWNGDRNFYERLTTFWRIGAPGSEVAVQMTLHDWQAFWGARENQPLAGQVVWQTFPAAARPVYTFVPADFALRAGENPARNAASDGRDAGFQADSLPILTAALKPAAKVDTKAAEAKSDEKLASQADTQAGTTTDDGSGIKADAKPDSNPAVPLVPPK